VIELAEKYKVKRLVVLSTDKAVYPINAMGMTKALMEKLMIAASRKLSEANNHGTILCGVRYGNVLYSRGSVIPFFVSLIKAGQPLTVTNPKMTRFLLPLYHSVDLVLYALLSGRSGDIYVRKSPAATIETLAGAVCKIFSYNKGFKLVGVRAGEKMHETLISEEEWQRVVDEKDYFRIEPETQGLDYNKYFSQGQRIKDDNLKSYTSENTDRLSVDQTVRLLLTLPEIQNELRSTKK
jgi:UDP-glucose 4-epimerase